MSRYFHRDWTVAIIITCFLILHFGDAAPRSSKDKNDSDCDTDNDKMNVKDDGKDCNKECDDDDDDGCQETNTEGLSSGAVAGILVGILLFLIGLTALACYLCAFCRCIICCTNTTSNPGKVNSGKPKLSPTAVLPSAPSYEETMNAGHPSRNIQTYQTVNSLTPISRNKYSENPPPYFELNGNLSEPNAPSPPEPIRSNVENSYSVIY